MDDAGAAARTPVRVRSRRAILGMASVGGAAFGCVALAVGAMVLLNRLSWVHTEPEGDPIVGINFSCNYAEYLLLEDPTRGSGEPVPDDRPGRAEWCANALGALLEQTGARHVRISVEWAQVEPREGQFDFDLTDHLLAEAQRHDAKVMLTVGVKAQRHPEYYIPGWALEGVRAPEGALISDDPVLRQRALRMVEAVARHTAASSAIDAWGADNEPFVGSKRANWWELGRDFVQEEIRIIREADPRDRPVVLNHAQHTLFDRLEPEWRNALEDADVFAISLYPFRNYDVLGRQMVFAITEFGPFVPNYAWQAREAEKAGREYWITEMQAEPWVDYDLHEVSPDKPSPNLGYEGFRKNMEYARRTGAERVYLWGAEWWLYQQERYGDGTWLGLAREAVSGGEDVQAREP